MHKTKIEWVRNPPDNKEQGLVWNHVTGCRNDCPHCYARALTERFGHIWGYDFQPRFHHDRLEQPLHRKKPAGVFTNSMGEIYAPWVPEGWIIATHAIIKNCPWHRFYTLTQFPLRLPGYNHPPNHWLGITAKTQSEFLDRVTYLQRANARIRFISFEPLLKPVYPSRRLHGIHWIIIGGRTGPRPFKPPDDWVYHIMDVANQYGIPIFIKNNLGWNKPPQEFPSGQ